MIVILRPTGIDAWAGIYKYRGCHEVLSPYFTRSGRLYTGLTEGDEKRLGEKLHIDLAQTSAEGSKFWANFHIRTSGKDLFLHVDEDPMDELKYMFLKNHKDIANGISDRKPKARFMIINQEEEAKEANTFARVKRRALKEFDRLTPEEMRQALRIFGSNAENLSPDVVENKLMEVVEANPEKFLANWTDNKNRNIEFVIKTAVSKNIIRKNKTIYKYGTDVIGYTLEDTINYLETPTNSDIKAAILREIDTK